MKKRFACLLCVLLIACTACGQNDTDEDADSGTMKVVETESEAEEPENGSNLVITTIDEEKEKSQEDIEYDIEHLSLEQITMGKVMDAYAYVSYLESEDYYNLAGHMWDEEERTCNIINCLFGGYYWWDYFVNDLEVAYVLTDYLDSLRAVMVSESVIEELAGALDPDFDGSLSEVALLSGNADTSLPKIDYKDGSYLFMSYEEMDFREDTLVFDSWTEHPDGTCTVVWHYYNEFEYQYVSPYNIRVYTFELSPNEWADDINPIFPYTIEIMTEAECQLILPRVDSYYYSVDELINYGLSPEQLYLARNEIYARHGRIFKETDLDEYFEGQLWYEGTIEGKDFDDIVFNEYEKVNIDIIKEAEAQYVQTEESEFSFADVAGEQFIYSSGAGAWSDIMTIQSDGTFYGTYSDWNGGEIVEGYDSELYPLGVYWWCDYSGGFTNLKQIDEYTYSVTVDWIEQEEETDTIEIKDDLLYHYSDPFLGVGDEVIIYLPGKSVAEITAVTDGWVDFGDLVYSDSYVIMDTINQATYVGYAIYFR